MFSFSTKRTRGPPTRLLPIRKNQDTLERKHSCVRKKLVRQWLAVELQKTVPTAAITGEDEDLDLRELTYFPNKFLKKWIEEGASVEALDEALGGVTPQSIHQLRESAGEEWLTWTFEWFTRKTSRLFHDQALTKIGLYISDRGHIFATLVSKSGDLITDIAIMNTIVYPKDYIDLDRAQEKFFIVEAIMHAAPAVNTFAHLMSVCHHMHSKHIAKPYYLQKREVSGFCQHWDTFFLYHTMVKGMPPEYVFQEVMQMDPNARIEMIMNFTNQVAYAAQILSHTWSDVPTSVPVHMPVTAGVELWEDD